jgi:site-specific DNA-cytosine methylase
MIRLLSGLTHTLFSISGGRHRSSENEFEKTKEALEQNHLFTKMVRIIHQTKAVHPHLVVVIENPRGLLQSMPLMKELESSMELQKVEVHYCAFGRGDQKPTHLWTNVSQIPARWYLVDAI